MELKTILWDVWQAQSPRVNNEPPLIRNHKERGGVFYPFDETNFIFSFDISLSSERNVQLGQYELADIGFFPRIKIGKKWLRNFSWIQIIQLQLN